MKIAIVGFGAEGRSLANHFLGKGHNITVCDIDDRRKQIKNLPGLRANFGPRYLNALQQYDLIFRSPGVPYLKHEFDPVREKLTSLTRYFFDKCPCPIVGVTGTKGKGTVSTLIYEMLKKTFAANPARKIYLGGNIGRPPLDFLDSLTPEDMVVLELSSFQLQDMRRSPHIAVVLAVSPDHLDYHKDLAEYADAKKNIIRFQNSADYAILDRDKPYPLSFEKEIKAKILHFSDKSSVEEGAFLKLASFVIKRGKTGTIIGEKSEIKLLGQHNIKNILAAALAADVAGASVEAITDVARNFEGLPHRLEFIREIDGLKFYNDSASTNPETAIAAVRSFTAPLILIAGGSDKNADYKPLGDEIAKRLNVKTVVLMGETKPKIERAIEEAASRTTQRRDIPLELISADSYQEAFMVAKLIAKPGDTVLLSPASASFDMFANYRERGEIFRNFVMDITR